MRARPKVAAAQRQVPQSAQVRHGARLPLPYYANAPSLHRRATVPAYLAAAPENPAITPDANKGSAPLRHRKAHAPPSGHEFAPVAPRARPQAAVKAAGREALGRARPAPSAHRAPCPAGAAISLSAGQDSSYCRDDKPPPARQCRPARQQAPVQRQAG